MKCMTVRGVAVFLLGAFVVFAWNGQANAFWGHRHGSYGGSSGVYGVGYGSSGAYASYGSVGYGSSGYGSSGSYASYASYGSSGYAASYGSSGYYGSSGRPTLGQRIHNHFAAKRAYRASYGSSGYYASSGGSYGSSGGSSGYSNYSYSSHGSSGYSPAVYGGGSSGSYGSVGSVYSSGVSYGSVGTSYGSAGTSSMGNVYYGADTSSSSATAASLVSKVDDDSVYLTVAVPTNAKIFVNGKATTSTGRVREYVSRGLKDGRSYRFEVRAELESADGQIMSESKTLVVQAGHREQIQFAFADDAKPIETAVTLNVPEGAQVFLAGNPTTVSGASRTFRTSKLVPGQTWDDYQIEVRHEGQVKNKSIRLKAGDQLQLTFAFDEAQEAAKLAAR